MVVLGGGPAGDVAALRASQLGAEVVLIERAELGGTCLNWGCIPTKSLLATADLLRRIRGAGDLGIEVGEVTVDFPRMMERKEEVVLAMRRGVESACKRRKVEVIRAQGRLEDGVVAVDGRRIEYDHLVVCVGTDDVKVPEADAVVVRQPNRPAYQAGGRRHVPVRVGATSIPYGRLPDWTIGMARWGKRAVLTPGDAVPAAWAFCPIASSRLGSEQWRGL